MYTVGAVMRGPMQWAVNRGELKTPSLWSTGEPGLSRGCRTESFHGKADGYEAGS
jgi:hypothetical protein